MQKPAKVHDKYSLKSLHEEIDLYDRKLAHMAKHETFLSDEDRETAIGKMSVRRASLARTAQKLAAEGIEFQPSDLPRSFRLQASDTDHSKVA